MTGLWESVAVAVVAVVGGQMLRTYLGRRKIRSDFDYAMQVVAKEAVKWAQRDHQVELDFSPESIVRLEGMLAKIHDGHMIQRLTEKELQLLSIRWGAYLGEAVKRVEPGKWARDSEIGKGTMPVIFVGGGEAFPCSWVYKRIADGPEDNIVFKFQVLSDPKLRSLMDNAPLPPSENTPDAN